MHRYNFIFSRRLPYWIARHLTFWVIFSLWFLQLCTMSMELNPGNYLKHLPTLISRLPICMLATYLTLYFLIPKYLLTKRYRKFVFAIALLAVALPLLVTFNPFEYFAHSEYASLSAPLSDGVWNIDDLYTLKVALWDGLGLMLGVSGFAAVLRLMTLYALENSENKRLQQQKVRHDLQLLKSQLNSRFLFVALQTIREHLRRQSPNSASLVLKFSDLLSYVLYENDEAFVALNKEIEVIDTYLALEQEGQGEHVSVTITRQGDFKGMQVVPLLLLPLVESCFEESRATDRNRREIIVDFNLDGVMLSVTLKVRHLRELGEEIARHRIRIKNVILRLHSYYNGRHQLDIHTAKNSYEVRLALNLQ